MRISDWSSDVCTSDLKPGFEQLLEQRAGIHLGALRTILRRHQIPGRAVAPRLHEGVGDQHAVMQVQRLAVEVAAGLADRSDERSLGKECVKTCRVRGSPSTYNKKKNTDN